MYGFVVVSIERLIATLWYSYYFNNKHRFICLFLGVVLLWTPPVISFLTEISVSSVSGQSPVIYCSSLSMGVHDFDFLIKVHLPLCALSITLCLTAMVISLRKKRCSIRIMMMKLYGGSFRQLHSFVNVEFLKQHYQLLENIRTTKLVVPNVFSYCVTLIIHITALLHIHKKTFDSEVSFAIAKEWSSFVLPLYANLFPLIFLLGSQEFKKYNFYHRFLMKFKCKRKLAPRITVIDYFRRP